MVFRRIDAGIKERAIELFLQGWDMSRIREALGVSEDSLRRWVNHYKETGLMVSDRTLCGRPSKIGPVLDELRALVNENPAIYLDELVTWAAIMHGILISKSSIHTALESVGMTLKKVHRTATQRDVLEGTLWHQNVQQSYTASQMVFLDETSLDNRNLQRTRYIATRFVQGAVNGDEFYDFVEKDVLPQMNPFPHRRSILVLDNASIHKSNNLRELVEFHGRLSVSTRCIVCHRYKLRRACVHRLHSIVSPSILAELQPYRGEF
ncbi:hypothetical protein BC834DRAFT_1015067 [Gloeopeniophorella convolvens]|nr:hypothetical protein BC834DRAFT_1015067 [Gloeopeniophorella convolvens]